MSDPKPFAVVEAPAERLPLLTVVSQTDAFPRVNSVELWLFARDEAVLQVTNHTAGVVYVSAKGRAFVMIGADWAKYQHHNLGAEDSSVTEDPLATAGELPEGPLAPAEMQRVLESLLGKVKEIEQMALGAFTTPCEEDRAEALDALWREMGLVVTCLRGLVRRGKKSITPDEWSRRIFGEPTEPLEIAARQVTNLSHFPETTAHSLPATAHLNEGGSEP